MSEIDRVHEKLSAFLEQFGTTQMASARDVIYKNLDRAKRRYVESRMDDQSLVDKIDRTEEALDAVCKSITDAQILDTGSRDRLASVMVEAMVCRRAVLPLEMAGDKPWHKRTVTPEEAISDDDDYFSTAIIDDVAESFDTATSKLLADDSAESTDATDTDQD